MLRMGEAMRISKLGWPKKNPAKPTRISKSKSDSRAAVRVRLNPLYRVKFTVNDAEGVQDFAVLNLSVTGFALLPAQKMEPWKSGDVIQGILSCDDEGLKLRARVIRIADGVIGCAFEGELAPIRKLLDQYFDQEIAALNMTQVKSSILKRDGNGTPYLFMGRNNCDLYYVANQKEVLRFSLHLFGNSIEGEKGKPVSLEAQDQIDVARKFLHQIDGLNPDHLKSLLAYL